MTLFIVSFIAGVLTVLAPCILPLLPVILAGSVAETGNRRRPFVIIASLSLSVLIFTLLLKGSTALIDASPLFWTYVSATILAAFGLTLLFPNAWARLILKIPGHNKPDSWIARGYGGTGSFWTDVLVGTALGPVFTTCSPTFFVILATVLPQSLAMGIIDLLAYIIGLALALLLISAIGQRIIDKLEWATNPYGWFKRLLGVLFIILAILIGFGLDKKLENAILKAGFFDVTKLEQSIHQSLENAAPSYPSADMPAIPGKANYTEIVEPSGFVNSQPFKLADLIGKKVILIDFIDYSCINCQRTFPYMKEWWKKYKDQGLEIVAIHTPEFSFEKQINNVMAAAKEFDLQFPIVLDNDYATWNAYRNQYWPHKYLIDIHGNVVYDHIGEGGYEETESRIVKLLNERKQVLSENGTVAMGTSTVSDYQVLAESPETYFGAMRNESFGNGPSYRTGEAVLKLPDTLTPNRFYLGGDWRIDQEYAEAKLPKAELSFTFTSSKMYLVAETADGLPVTATVLLDGHPIPDAWAGADVKGGMLTIKGSRLYQLYSNPSLGRHRIDLIFSKPGVRVYTFTFG